MFNNSADRTGGKKKSPNLFFRSIFMFNEIIKDSILIPNSPFPDYQTIWFDNSVGVDSLVHDGFLVPDVDSGEFRSKIASPRISL